LNLIERFWWLLKKEAIYNEYFPTFAGFRAAMEAFFANLDDYRDEVERRSRTTSILSANRTLRLHDRAFIDCSCNEEWRR
jgi:hypothetical protein